MPEQEAINYIKERIVDIEADEKQFQEDYALPNETITFSTEDVVQELKWVLAKLEK